MYSGLEILCTFTLSLSRLSWKSSIVITESLITCTCQSLQFNGQGCKSVLIFLRGLWDHTAADIEVNVIQDPEVTCFPRHRLQRLPCVRLSSCPRHRRHHFDWLFRPFPVVLRHHRPVLCRRPGPRCSLVRPVSLSSFCGRPSPDPHAAISSQYLIKL